MSWASSGRPVPRIDRGALGVVGVGVGAGFAAGYLLLHGSLVVALAFCTLPLILWLVARPAVGVVLVGGSIPVLYDLTGGRGGFHLALSDVLLVLVTAGVILGGSLAGSIPALHALRPVKPVVAQYGFFLLLLLMIHFSLKGVAQVGQRFELFLIPLIVGAFAALAGRQLTVLKAYVLAASALALAWPFMHSLGQKNPVGQMVANALLLLVGVRSLRRYAPLGIVLVPGLFLSGSRGALVATAVGIVVILALQQSRARTAFTRLSLLFLVALVTYAVLPVSLQGRLTTFAPGTGSSAAYALHIRQQYVTDARHLIASHPIAGVGVGNYLTGDPRNLTQATDPHNVLLLEAAEGGYAFALSFVILILGVGLALRRMAAAELAPAAAGIFLATFGHGLVDVYWVRATPVLAWMLVGMVCGAMARHTAPDVQPSEVYS
jgi:hypothetical protein